MLLPDTSITIILISILTACAVFFILKNLSCIIRKLKGCAENILKIKKSDKEDSLNSASSQTPGCSETKDPRRKESLYWKIHTAGQIGLYTEAAAYICLMHLPFTYFKALSADNLPMSRTDIIKTAFFLIIPALALLSDSRHKAQ